MDDKKPTLEEQDQQQKESVLQYVMGKLKGGNKSDTEERLSKLEEFARKASGKLYGVDFD
jgi:predicted transcriptional regulator